MDSLSLSTTTKTFCSLLLLALFLNLGAAGNLLSLQMCCVDGDVMLLRMLLLD